MWVTRLALTHFRNYVHEEVQLAPGANLLLGGNAQGKSNLLEALVCLSTTRSYRTATERNLIGRQFLAEPIPYARLVAHLEGAPVRTVELVITVEAEDGAPRTVRHLRLDGVAHKVIDALGVLPTVLFTPEDVALIAGPPIGRRRFLDILLCQASREYCRALSLYNRSLAQRNSLVRLIRARHSDPSQLDYWDELLASNGAVITSQRHQAILQMQECAAPLHASLAAAEPLRLVYCPNLSPSEGSSDLPDLREAMLAAYRSCRATDIERGVTTVGPHRDDFAVMLNGLDAGNFGSRGQMRSAALSLRLAEAVYLAQALGRQPLLLFDDVMSELDSSRRRALEGIMLEQSQSLITGLDEAPFSPGFLAQAHLYRVQAGRVLAVPSSADAAPAAQGGAGTSGA